MTTMYRIFWKNIDFPTHSEGPILMHHHTRTSFGKGTPFTKEEAQERCDKFNNKAGNAFTEREAKTRNKQIKINQVKKGDLKITHWVEQEDE